MFCATSFRLLPDSGISGKPGQAIMPGMRSKKKSVGMIVHPVFPEPAARYFFSARFRQCSQMTTSRMAIRVAQDAE